MRISWWLTCSFLLAAGAGLGQRVAEFEGHYWITGSTQRMKFTENGVGTDINFKSDLGFKDRNFAEVRFNFQSQGRSRLRISYVQMGYDGDRNVQRTIDFSGKTYTVGARVVSAIEFKDLRVGWGYQFINVAEGKFRVGTLLAAHCLWLKASLAAPDLRPPISESEKAVAPLPTVGIALDINPDPKVNISGDFSGITIGKYGYALDGELALKVLPVRHLGLTAGYRLFRLNPKFDPDYVLVRISGPFVGASFRF